MAHFKSAQRGFKTANQPIKSVKKDDTVAVIAGKFKGKTGKVLTVSVKAQTVTVEGLGVVSRHIKPNQFNPQGGSKEVHVPLDISKVKKVEKAAGEKKPAAKVAKTTPKKETK